jgi:hypothetical protein
VSDLNNRLNSALTAVEPGPAPVEAAMRNGTKIRHRRRAWAVAGSAAAVGIAAACYPALAHQEASPPPVTSQVRVTVNPPGPHSQAGLIASGLVGTGSWQWIATPQAVRQPPGQIPPDFGCTQTTQGSQVSLVCILLIPDASGSDGSGPVAFSGVSAGVSADKAVWGLVADPAVSYLTVRLADGSVLTLHPTTLYGKRYVAFALPPRLGVDNVTAYSPTGEIATVIAYNNSGEAPSFGTWLRPG